MVDFNLSDISTDPTINDVKAIEQPAKAKRGRGRKLKQTSLVDLFKAPKATVDNENKRGDEGRDGIISPSSSTTTEVLSSDGSPSRVSVIISPAKSSRYGRIIRPKTYELDSAQPLKKRKFDLTPQIVSETAQPAQTDRRRSSVTLQSNEIATPNKMPKKRGRPKKNQSSSQMNSSSSVVPPLGNDQNGHTEASNTPRLDETLDSTLTTSEISSIPQLPRKRGRPSRTSVIAASDATPAHDDSPQSTPINETPSKKPRKLKQKKLTENDSIIYTCGACNELVPKSKWYAHTAKHYGVAWRMNIDEAIDVNDNHALIRTLNRFMKSNKLHHLKCDKCSEKKRSALGYISHVEICGLTSEEIIAMKSECPHCKKLYRKVSLETHIQNFCTVRRMEKAEEDAVFITPEGDVSAVEPAEQVIYSASGRPKRTIKPTQTNKRNVDEFIKVGLKITGGVVKQWRDTLQTASEIKCTNSDCVFSTTDVNKMRMHHKECRTRVLQCRLCLTYFNGRDEIVRHIDSEHKKDLEPAVSEEETSSGDEDDDYKAGDQSSSSDDEAAANDDNFDDEEDSNGTRSKKSKAHNRKSTVSLTRVLEDDSPEFWDMIKVYFSRIANVRPGFFKLAYTWTKEYTEANYDRSALILNDHLDNDINYKYLTQVEHGKCLNKLERKSMKFTYEQQSQYTKEMVAPTNPTWSTLDLFGSSKMPIDTDDSAILFCGGRIVSMRWIPYPSDYSGNQTLIVCTQNRDAPCTNATNHQSMSRSSSHSTLMQLWSVSMEADKINGTRYAYGIEYSDGPVNAMAICPSDAYIPSKRLAIVAIPDRNGHVNILSLPDIKCKPSKNIVRLTAQVKLQLTYDNDEEPAQCVTQLTWSRLKGHKILCAGYNTGLVAIWNFDQLNSSYLCRTGADGVRVLLPYKLFQAALTCISHLDMHADNEHNVRWLLVGSLERRIRMYDLNDAQLTPFVSPIFKSRILAGVWPLHWPVYLAMVDAAWTRLGGGLHIKQILYTNNQPQSSTLYLDSHSSNLAFNDWLNTVIFGNDAGDVFMVNFHQMLAHDRNGNSSEMKILSSTDVFVEVDSATNESTEHIIFNEFKKGMLASRNQTRILAPNQNLSSKINRIECNPNESHHSIYAIGYDIGFCRIACIIPKTTT